MSLVQFSYKGLDAETRIVVQQKTSEIKELVQKSQQSIIDIGNRLIEVKEKLAHGSFGAWLATEFEWDRFFAERCMNIARRFGQNEQIAHFQKSALYLLSSPSVPEEAVKEAVARAEQGEEITHKTAKAIAEKHRPDPKPQPSLTSGIEDDWIIEEEPSVIVLEKEQQANGHAAVDKQTPPLMHDSLKREIPSTVRPVFETLLPVFKTLRQLLIDMRTKWNRSEDRLTSSLQVKGFRGYAMAKTALEDDIPRLIRLFHEAMPYTLCPYCKGRETNCQVCGCSGVVIEKQFAEAPTGIKPEHSSTWNDIKGR